MEHDVCEEAHDSHYIFIAWEFPFMIQNGFTKASQVVETRLRPLISYPLRNLKVFSCTSTHICASLINQKQFLFYFFVFPWWWLMADGKWWFMFHVLLVPFHVGCQAKISFWQSLLFYWRFVFNFFLPFSHNMNPIAHSASASENIHFDYIRTYYHFIYVRSCQKE